MGDPRTQAEITSIPKRIHNVFLVAINISSFLGLTIQLIFKKKRALHESQKKRLQRENLNPSGAFILALSRPYFPQSPLM
jgi:hypothetical protein